MVGARIGTAADGRLDGEKYLWVGECERLECYGRGGDNLYYGLKFGAWEN